jgi:polyhydroxyalkanoate synthase
MRKEQSPKTAELFARASAGAAPSTGPRSWAARLDGRFHAFEGHLTGGISPFAYPMAFLDWAVHLANSPFQELALAKAALTQWARLAKVAVTGVPALEPDLADRRFRDDGWKRRPFQILAQAHLLAEEWWTRAAEVPTGVSREHQRLAAFAIRQLLDLAAPSNVPLLNPEVLRATVKSRGRNFVAGAANLVSDLHALARATPPEPPGLRVGRELAVTPGKVIFRNALIELLQYTPTTAEVAREPVLIVPAWIMKYYILDLSPHNSLIRYLVSKGHTVFTISWRNPGAELRDASLDDYRQEGILAALGVVDDICGSAKVHACGYCLGGTLLAIAAAAMARDGDDRLATVSLLCAQTDFTEPGELALFVTEDQLSFLEEVMRAKGYLTSRQMGGSFQVLRSNDLLFSPFIRSYFLGTRDPPNDLMAWNADGTRMPARMHGEYLRRLFLGNDLAAGRFAVNGKPIAVRDIRAPLFVLGTEMDHVAPWRSVYKIHHLNDADLTFVLTSGGHNAGVVSEPGHPRRHFRVARRPPGAPYTGPDEWLSSAETRKGSWWTVWSEWLGVRSGGPVAPPKMGSSRHPPLDDAPGRYVFER